MIVLLVLYYCVLCWIIGKLSAVHGGIYQARGRTATNLGIFLLPLFMPVIVGVGAARALAAAWVAR